MKPTSLSPWPLYPCLDMFRVALSWHALLCPIIICFSLPYRGMLHAASIWHALRCPYSACFALPYHGMLHIALATQPLFCHALCCPILACSMLPWPLGLIYGFDELPSSLARPHVRGSGQGGVVPMARKNIDPQLILSGLFDPWRSL